MAIILGTLRILAVLLFLAAPAQNTRAFGPEGHRMVADIAAGYLNPKAREQVLLLLKYDRLADGQPSDRHTLGEIAFWADEIRDVAWGKRYGAWHYDDVPLCEEPDYSTYCRNGRCASAQIAQHLELLGKGTGPSRRRNEALKWVVHLMGDIHQPLHAATRHDRGGNTVQVSFFGERDNPPYGTINLHAIWDVHIVRRLIADRGGERAITSADVEEPVRAAWGQGSFADWVGESHAVARDFVYQMLPVPSSCSQKIHEVVAIDQAYYSKAAPILETQIRKAGIRLARVLNETLGQ